MILNVQVHVYVARGEDLQPSGECLRPLAQAAPLHLPPAVLLDGSSQALERLSVMVFDARSMDFGSVEDRMSQEKGETYWWGHRAIDFCFQKPRIFITQVYLS